MNIRELAQYKKNHTKVACLTAYDATFAKLLSECSIDVVLIGDSLGMTISGYKNTLRVSMKQMLYHTKSVSRGVSQSSHSKKPLVVADMPWGSVFNPKKALNNAMRFIKNGADMVKIEGAAKNEIKAIRLIRSNGIPVCGHLGLRPQNISMTGAFLRQGLDDDSSKKIFNEALRLDEIGVEMIVLECIPDILAEKITSKVKASTIGIGTYSPCDGQILVLYDLLGISGKTLKFSKDFLAESKDIRQAVMNYIDDVRNLKFPLTQNQ